MATYNVPISSCIVDAAPTKLIPQTGGGLSKADHRKYEMDMFGEYLTLADMMVCDDYTAHQANLRRGLPVDLDTHSDRHWTAAIGTAKFYILFK
jgi:hypothetical protein